MERWIAKLMACEFAAALIIAAAMLCCGVAHGRDNGQWENADPAVRQWYDSRSMTEATRQRLGVNYKSCCDHGDVVHTQIRRTDLFGNTQWFWLDGETWREIPPDIIQYGQFPPGNQPVLFVYAGKAVCFFPPEAGGI